MESAPQLALFDSPSVCIECKKAKPSSEFYDGRTRCKVCFKRRRRAYYKQNRDRIRAHYHTPAGWSDQIVRVKRSKCKREDIPFDLTADWVRTRVRRGCAVTGLPFEFEPDRRSPFGPSIDRIEPGEGYTKENCRVVCKCFNQARGDWSDEDVLKMARHLLDRSV